MPQLVLLSGSVDVCKQQLGNDPPVSECVEYSKIKHSYTEMMEVESNDCATYAHLFTEVLHYTFLL